MSLKKNVQLPTFVQAGLTLKRHPHISLELITPPRETRCGSWHGFSCGDGIGGAGLGAFLRVEGGRAQLGQRLGGEGRSETAAAAESWLESGAWILVILEDRLDQKQCITRYFCKFWYLFLSLRFQQDFLASLNCSPV